MAGIGTDIITDGHSGSHLAWAVSWFSVTGFDGGVGAGLLHPPLTSVVIPVEDIARRVVGRVLRQIEDGQDTDPGEIVATWLREGESTQVHQ